jgi:hypothetical protein
MATLFVDKVDPQSGTSLEIGSSGDTITIPSGATITNSGTATGFGQEGFTFYAYKTGSAQSISQTTFTTATLDTELFDDNSGFASDKYTFTASTAGTYYVFGNIFHGGSGAISSSMQTITKIRLNGSTDLFYNNRYSASTSNIVNGYIMVHGCKTFSDGDYIELQGYSSLASPTFEAGTGYYTFMGGYKIS